MSHTGVSKSEEKVEITSVTKRFWRACNDIIRGVTISPSVLIHHVLHVPITTIFTLQFFFTRFLINTSFDIVFNNCQMQIDAIMVIHVRCTVHYRN